MSSQKNYHSITNLVYAYCHIWALIWYCLLSIALLCQGCSTENQSQQASMEKSPSNEQVKPIGAPKLMVKKASYDFGEIAFGSRNTAVFNFTNAGEALELSMPDELDELGAPYYILVDRVEYSDGVHPEDCPGSVDFLAD